MTSRKRAGLAVGMGVGAAAATALRRRWRNRPEAPGPGPEPAAGIDASLANRFVRNLSAAIRFPTVSSIEGVDAGIFGDFRDFLEKTYPLTHSRLRREVVGDHTLLFTWPGSDQAAQPMLLMAHQDVVPVEPGTEGDWEQAPFSGDIVDGYVWGRGAMDDKASLIGILEAVESLLASGFAPGPTVHILLGHDEEVGGGRGAAVVAERFRAEGVRLGLVLDEGGAVVSGVLPGVPALALVGVGEKASLDVELSAAAEGGHSSMPPPHTAVGLVAAAVRAVERHPMPARLEVQRAFFSALAEVVGGTRALLLRNLQWSRPVVERLLARSVQTNALIRTTAAATMIRGGVKSNVLPQEATAIVNFRILPGDTAAGVLDHVRSVVGDGIRVRPIDFGATSDPGPLCPLDSPGFARVADAVKAAFPGVAVAPWILLGATDARYFVPLADAVCRFAPLTAALSDMARIHGTGERIAVADAGRAVAFYRHVITGGSQETL